MKKSRFSDSQILAILKQAESGTPVANLCREHEMSNACFYQWCSNFGGMDASMMKRLKELVNNPPGWITAKNHIILRFRK